MEWIQVLAITLPVVLALVIGFLYNNSRLNDLNKRIDDLRSDTNQRFSDINQRLSEMHNDISELKNLMLEFLKKEAGYTVRDK